MERPLSRRRAELQLLAEQRGRRVLLRWLKADSFAMTASRPVTVGSRSRPEPIIAEEIERSLSDWARGLPLGDATEILVRAQLLVEQLRDEAFLDVQAIQALFTHVEDLESIQRARVRAALESVKRHTNG